MSVKVRNRRTGQVGIAELDPQTGRLNPSTIRTSESREQQYGTISARPGFLERSLPAAGQLIGGVGGGLAGGIPGGIAGATAGATAGRLGQQFLRRGRGEQITGSETVRELGTEAIMTGAAESVLPIGGKFLGPMVTPHLQRFGQRTVGPRVGSLFRFMTGIEPENTARLLERGPRHILTKLLMAREKGTRLAEEFLGNAQAALKKVNQDWDTVVTPLRNTTASVEAEPIRQVARATEREFVGVQGPVLESLKDVFSALRGAVGDIEALTSKPRFMAQAKQVTSPILSPTGKQITSEVTERVSTLAPAKRLSLDKAIRARQQLDDVIFTGKAQGLLSERQVVALKQLRTAFKDTIHQAFPQIAKVDEQRHVLGEAVEVVKRFSPESVTNVARLRKMIDAFESTTVGPEIREALQQADHVIQQQTGKSLLGAIRDRSAAQAFEPTELRSVRTWLISTIAGILGFGAGGPGGSAVATALGLTLSSPRLAGQALKGTMAVGRGATFLARKTAPVAVAETGRQLLQPQQNR